MLSSLTGGYRTRAHSGEPDGRNSATAEPISSLTAALGSPRVCLSSPYGQHRAPMRTRRAFELPRVRGY